MPPMPGTGLAGIVLDPYPVAGEDCCPGRCARDHPGAFPPPRSAGRVGPDRGPGGTARHRPPAHDGDARDVVSSSGMVRLELPRRVSTIEPGARHSGRSLLRRTAPSSHWIVRRAPDAVCITIGWSRDCLSAWGSGPPVRRPARGHLHHHRRVIRNGVKRRRFRRSTTHSRIGVWLCVGGR